MTVTHSAMHGESGYARVEHDAYWTPAWCTEALLDAIPKPSRVWEPACGKGNITQVLRARGVETIESDLIDHTGSLPRQLDFLKCENIGPVGADIITNPPYVLAEQFVRHAIKLTSRHGNRVAMLLRNEWDCASTRQDLFEQAPFMMKLVLTKRPRWSTDDKASPRHNFAWFIWDWLRTGPPTIAYAPCRSRGDAP